MNYPAAELRGILLIKNARIINVFSGEIVSGDIAVAGGYIAGCFVAPGFIDAHVHIESAMTCITEFARAVLPCGTTTVVADPHEIANVLGTAGIEYMLQSGKHQPVTMRNERSHTKIIATISPATSSREIPEQIIHEGVDVCRINFSHCSHEDHLKTIKIIH